MGYSAELKEEGTLWFIIERDNWYVIDQFDDEQEARTRLQEWAESCPRKTYHLCRLIDTIVTPKSIKAELFETYREVVANTRGE